MKKKGFTLIELLAIIVILAIIALIAVPVVLNIIDKARVSSYERSSENIISAARLYYSETILDKTTNIRGNIYEEIVGTMSGDTPDEGEIYINSEGKIAAGLKYGNYCYTKNYTDTGFTKTDLIEEDKCVAPKTSYKCIRASVLHTEECTQTSSYCYAAGYTTDGSKGITTITYGNLGTLGESPVSGDAFDCNIDGEGYNHRFYYVTDLESNPEYAVLVYYNNTTNGEPDNSSAGLVAYDSRNENWHGPVDAITNLPTITQWTNISLTSTTRAITRDTGETSTKGGTLPTGFSYTKTVNGETVDLAARLLTYQEVSTACGESVVPRGRLDGCNYLMENTKYSNSSNGTSGYWLETSSYDTAWSVSGNGRQVISAIVDNTSARGTRPAIEVLKSQISY